MKRFCHRSPYLFSILLLALALPHGAAATDYSQHFRMIGQAGVFNSSINHATGIALGEGVVHVVDGQGFPEDESYFYWIDWSGDDTPVYSSVLPIPGYARGLCMAGGNAIAACADTGLLSIDVSGADPVFEHQLGLGYAWNVISENDTVYVAGGSSGLHIVDYGDPNNPQILGQLDTAPYDGCTGVAKADTLLFLTVQTYNNGSSLWSVSMSDPAAPYVGSTLDFPDLRLYDIALAGNTAYLVDNNTDGGLQVVDVSDPAAMVARGFADGLQNPNCVTLLPDRTGRVAVGEAGVAIVDVGAPDFPILLGVVDTYSSVLDLEATDGTLFAAGQGAGVCAFDASASGINHAVTRVESDTWLSYLDVDGGYAYATGWNSGEDVYRLEIIDVVDPLAPALATSVDLPGYFAGEPLVMGDYAYLPCPQAGVQVIDVSDPTVPVLGALVGGMLESKHICYWEGHLIVADGTAGIKVLDLSDPALPVLVGQLALGHLANEVTVFGDYAYVADGADGLRIVSLANPAAPALAGTYHYLGTYTSVAVNWPYAYCVAHTTPMSHMWIVDVSVPSAPVLEELFYIPGECNRARIRGGNLYLNNQNGGMWHLTLEDPALPSWHGFVDLEDRVGSMDTEGEFLFAASTNGGLLIAPRHLGETPVWLDEYSVVRSHEHVDIRWSAIGEELKFWLSARQGNAEWSVPWRQTTPGNYSAHDEDKRLGESGEVIYSLFTREDCDWRLLRTETIASGPALVPARLHPAHPDPFNPHTTLAFDLAFPQRVRLTIHDVAGRLITVLAEGEFGSGRHEIAWDGSDRSGRPVSGGHYFARLAAAGEVQARRLVLLR